MKTRAIAHDDIPDTYQSLVELVRSLMGEHGMNESALGRLLGDRSLGHRILSGERNLSKANIRIMAKHFSLNPGALL